MLRGGRRHSELAKRVEESHAESLSEIFPSLRSLRMTAACSNQSPRYFVFNLTVAVPPAFTSTLSATSPKRSCHAATR